MWLRMLVSQAVKQAAQDQVRKLLNEPAGGGLPGDEPRPLDPESLRADALIVFGSAAEAAGWVDLQAEVETWPTEQGTLHKSQMGAVSCLAWINRNSPPTFLEDLIPSLHPFGTRRSEDLIHQLEILDASGCCSPREAADWLEHLEISQSPGAGAIQVMTIHKSKGLGFDLVVLPDVSNDAIPKANQFETASGPGWILQAPPRWARRMFPPLRDAEDQWARRQQYEAICGLYVALTRAKRGLHLLLDPAPANEREPDRPSIANWLRASTGCSADDPIYQIGRAGWTSQLADIEETPPDGPPPAQTARRLSAPRSNQARLRPRSRRAIEHGIHIHSLLQSIAWIDDQEIHLPQEIAHFVSRPAMAPIFQRQGRNIRLLQEQAVLSEDETGSLWGVIDRLHLHLSPDQRIHLVEIIDFKTDSVTSLPELAERHAAQLDRYAAWVAKIHPDAEISRILVSVPLGELIRL